MVPGVIYWDHGFTVRDTDMDFLYHRPEVRVQFPLAYGTWVRVHSNMDEDPASYDDWDDEVAFAGWRGSLYAFQPDLPDTSVWYWDGVAWILVGAVAVVAEDGCTQYEIRVLNHR